MKVAYADPPYIGQAKCHYSNDPQCAEVDHAELIGRLCRDYDAWALSCSSTTLNEVFSYCPNDVRVAAWVKPFASFKPNVNPAYCWEPVVFWHPRKRKRHEITVRDWLAESCTMKRGLVGAKSEKFCFWIFDLLNLNRDDEFHDLYPGSGAVTRAWKIWSNQLKLELISRKIDREQQSLALTEEL